MFFAAAATTMYELYAEAVTQGCSWEKVLWKYATNLQENTYPEVQFQ